MNFQKTRKKLHSERTVSVALSGADVPALDAEVLLAHVLERERAWLFAHSEDKLSSDQCAAFDRLIEKRRAHMPVAYLTGHKEFFGLDLLVTPDVLIPRPETETLVEITLTFAPSVQNLTLSVPANEFPKEKDFGLTIIDVGTGSGAIACALASRTNESVQILALDASTQALEIARHNASLLGLSHRITFKKSALLNAVATSYQLKAKSCILVANLPYLSEKDYEEAVKLCPDIAYEPKSALVAGPEGTELIQALLQQASSLMPSSPVFLEIGERQGDEMKKIATQFYPSANCTIRKDLSGRDRFAIIETQP